MLPVEDRLAIRELIEMHGHVCDAGAFDRLGEILTDDVVYDVSDLGGGVIRGLAECRDASVALGKANPVAHLVTNVVIGHETTEEVDRMDVASKGLGLMTSGELGSVVYRDRVVRTPAGWRIEARRVLARREPLSPYSLPF